MGFGFRVGVPGMSVRVSTRGVRTSVGPRIARVSVGSGGTRVSSGLGPFFASSSVGGSRRRTTTRRTSYARSTGPSPAQLQRAQRAAERAQREAERDALIAELHALRRRSTSVHLQTFPTAHPPMIPPPPELGLAWARAEAAAFHLRGVGRFARSQRSQARERAVADAASYLAFEQDRLARTHRDLVDQAGAWWQLLVANDEETVCDAVNAAFADNPAAGCAVGLEDRVLSVVMRQQDLDSLPTQTPGVTQAGRPTLKTLTKRDRTLWWLTVMGSNVIATVKEALATAPAVDAVDLAVITRLPDTQRLDVVAFGRWTRRAIESTPWRAPEDALRFLDVGEGVECAVTTTATRIKPVDTRSAPGLRTLVDTAIDDGLDTPPDQPTDADPYAITPFARWAGGRGEPVTPPTAPAPPEPVPGVQVLVPGQTLVLPDEAHVELALEFGFAGAEADLTLLLLGSDEKVRSDADFVFYNQPAAARGAVRLVGRHRDGGRTVDRAAVFLAAVPDEVRRVAVSISTAVGGGSTCGSLQQAELRLTCPGASWVVPTPADPQVRAMTLAELYRHVVDGRPSWKLRAVGQGWAEGLPALARAYGVDVD
ncbi:MAG: hypothetical protein ABS81_07050 [Pseudonocardia sp. SCN 72-86]|nr:MAG: hypothetical protein ABS81_07050 [Pseudonocardia sp. SCN 72-86]